MNRFIISRYNDDDSRVFEFYIPVRKFQLTYTGDKVSPAVVADVLNTSPNFSCDGYETVRQYDSCPYRSIDMFLFILTTENALIFGHDIFTEANEIIERLTKPY